MTFFFILIAVLILWPIALFLMTGICGLLVDNHPFLSLIVFTIGITGITAILLGPWALLIGPVASYLALTSARRRSSDE
jgi:hypothetical protein